jgi:MFS family permease
MRSISGLGLRLRPERRVFAGFAVHALTMGSLFPRLPEIRDAMGVGEGALGLGLIGVPVGTLIALTTAAPLLERVGYRRALMMAMPLAALAYAVAMQATGPLAFFLLLIPAGLLIGSVEIILNVEADRTEALIGRRIMNRAHAFWSIGFFGTGLLGAGVAQLGVSPQAHLALVVPFVLLAVLLIFGRFEPAPSRAVEEAAPRVAKPTWPILVLVAVTLSAVLMEGAGLDWSAIYMTNLWGSDSFVAGLAVALVAGSQAVGRYFSDDVVERYSPVVVARVQLGILAVGLVLLMMAPGPVLSLASFALLGFGTSALFPLAMSAAAQRTDRPAPVNVAALAQIAFVAFLLGPPLLGFVGEHWGIRWVYGLGLPFVALSFVAAEALGRGSGRAAAADPGGVWPDRAGKAAGERGC